MSPQPRTVRLLGKPDREDVEATRKENLRAYYRRYYKNVRGPKIKAMRGRK